MKDIRSRLGEQSWPQILGVCAVANAGLFAFLTSFWLLRWGVSSMVVRYPIATALGYLVFLLLIRLFVALFHWGIDPDVLYPERSTARSRPVRKRARRRGGASKRKRRGGRKRTGRQKRSGGSSWDGAGVDFGFGILWIPLLLAAAFLGPAIYVVNAAPALLAELVVDVVILSTIARPTVTRRDGFEPLQWVSDFVRPTLVPFLLVTALVFTAACIAAVMVPGAHSIGEVFGR